ncbi:MAG: WecB/TagA/CpsF family glycosyltransferase [Acidimicrobiia bacterium]|nr:WecB/TagA/CpsF family glycosyltransferase [Acidimicrobiia bacterium]
MTQTNLQIDPDEGRTPIDGLGPDDTLGPIPAAALDRSIALLLGIPIDILTMAEALDRAADLIVRARATGRTHQLVTVNVDFVVNALTDAQLRSILRRSDLAIADGMPLVWASRLFGPPLPERVAGVDLVSLLAERSAREGFSMLLFGGRPGVADQAAARLIELHPGLRVRGMDCPPLADDGYVDPELVDAVRAAAADIVCVALGHPKQDKWIAAHRHDIGAPLLLGVGASLDFISGVAVRAPVQMQRNGLEWLHRLIHEPRRLGRRYSRDLVHFAPRVAAQRLGAPALTMRTPRATTGLDGIDVTIWMPSVPEPVTTPWGSDEFTHHAKEPVVVVVDVNALPASTWQGLAALVGIGRRLRHNGGELIVAGGTVTRAGRWWHHHLDGHITIYPDLESASLGARLRTANGWPTDPPMSAPGRSASEPPHATS